MAITAAALLAALDVRTRMIALTDAQVVDLAKAWVNTWDALAPELEDALVDALADPGKFATKAKLSKNARLAATLQQSRAAIDELASYAATRVSNDIPEAVLEATRAHVAISTAQLPPGAAAAGISFDLPATGAVDAIVARSIQQIHSGSMPLPADIEALMKRELIRGVAVGDNPRTTARRMVSRAEGRFNGGLSRAGNIARTETLDAHRAGGYAAAQQNADLLQGWIWSAQLDARTCPSCLSNHGQLHPTEEEGPYDHQRGRCARIDKTKSWKDLGFDIPEPKDETPDARSCSTPNDRTA